MIETDDSDHCQLTTGTGGHRRDWMIGVVRWSIALLLSLTTAVLTRRFVRAGCIDRRLACGACPQQNRCRLPRSRRRSNSIRK